MKMTRIVCLFCDHRNVRDSGHCLWECDVRLEISGQKPQAGQNRREGDRCLTEGRRGQMLAGEV